MRRVDNASSVATLPSIPAAGTPGYFTEGDPATGQAATDVPAWWLNGIQGEIDHVITQNSLTPDKTDFTQLYQAIAAQIASMASAMTSLIPAVQVLGGGTATSFTTVDCSAVVPSGTAAVFLYVKGYETLAGADAPVCHIRHPSDADQGFVLVGGRNLGGSIAVMDQWDLFGMAYLNSSRQFEYRIENATNKQVDIEIRGYM